MATDTLIIKHFPKELSCDDRVKFLKQCGAIDVNLVTSKINNYSLAFARFSNEFFAEKALHHLHQQEVMGSYLLVEYARGKTASQLDNEAISTRSKLLKETGTETLLKRFLDKLNGWAAGVDFRAPVPSHLKYHYPPPTTATLQNIAEQLASSPRFYTQVLHLMNKMNLPCPIRAEVQTPTTLYKSHIPIVSEAPLPTIPHTVSSSESELSSEEDKMKETIPIIIPKVKKTIKRPKLIKPVILQTKNESVKTKKTKFDEVFEDPKTFTEISKPKKPKLFKPPSPLLSTEENDTPGFGFIHPVVQESAKEIEKVDIRSEMEEERLVKDIVDCITLEALAANRISEKDRAVLPVYKNYAEGAPTCRLYIKNLSKQTTETELRFIFSRFLAENIGDSPNMFDVRLMQEGRMKGQAFVTLQSVELAQSALGATNGYILNDKPMVVQFARSAVK